MNADIGKRSGAAKSRRATMRFVHLIGAVTGLGEP